MRGMSELVSVYVVDDDDAMRDSLMELLEPEGFEIRTFSSVDELMNELEKNPLKDGSAACLLLNLNMPGSKGGLDLLAVLAERDCSLPIVVLNGNIDAKTRTQALKRGAVAFLRTPVDADRLIDTLRNSNAK